MVNYYAVNMCIQNWDGFFNNYFLYHDPRPDGKWEMFPWDEDKTWGDHDGASRRCDWYEMPLTFGMTGDKPVGGGGLLSGLLGGGFGGGPFGGVMWWRPPGHFSGPLLANPEFRRRFLARLGELCRTVFAPEVMDPVIDALAARLEPEVVVRARLHGQPEESALDEFRVHIRSFHDQVKNRRRYILEHLPAAGT
jgi:spore coat protein CotH